MDLYREMLVQKYIRVGKKNGLRILNYTEKAQFESVWNSVTCQCRGLVIDKYWNVLARPFDKFQNYGQLPMDLLLSEYEVEVTDKMDGSLGILFHVPGVDNWEDRYISGIDNAVYYAGRWEVATRGSFDSDQSEEMRQILREKYSEFYADSKWTYMFEIIYPGNRIVLNYGEMRDLVLLGARNNHTGLVRPAEAVSEWVGPKTTSFPYKTLREALEAPPRPNAEGYVIYFPDLDYRVKLKQDDYVALHKIVTGLTPRRVWENMKAGKTLADLIEIIPDEWHHWLQQTHEDINYNYLVKLSRIQLMFADISKRLPMGWTRRDFAELAVKCDYSGFMFMLLDGRDISDKVWDLIKPISE